MIYCFSGTGNTLHVAKNLGILLGHEVHIFTASELREPENCVLQSEDGIVIWTFPTYSWGVPPIVRNIIRQATLDFGVDTVHLAVTTCGDDTGKLARMFRRDIGKRNLKGGAVYSVTMPNTYVMMKGFDTDPKDVAEAKIKRSAETIRQIADAISSGKTSKNDDILIHGKFAWFKTAVIYPYFTRFDMSPKGFHVDTQKCIKCGKCAKTCPLKNIQSDEDGHPCWGDKCAFCTACYHVCPTHAVGWKKTTDGKGQVRYF